MSKDPIRRLWRSFSIMSIALFTPWMSYARSVYLDANQDDWCPVAVSIVPAVEIPPKNWDVYGLRINFLVGRHNDVGGLDIGGLVNFTKGKTFGLQSAALYNQIGEGCGMIQVSGIANRCKGDFIGLQTSAVFSLTDNTLIGCQMALLSFSGTLEGLQVGLFNRVEGGCGLQIGVVNYAYQAEGVQIGLINIIADAPLPILPVVNVGF